MSRFLRSLLLAAAGLLAAVIAYVGVTLPPSASSLAVNVPPTVVYGAYHIHSVRSDGSGTVDEIATEAARAGLAFVILTDHGDATRPPDPPEYRHGVLCIDAVEINTLAGHLVALGLDRPSPYPLAGEARDVVDDVHRLGGWAAVAHPDSPNPDLRWKNWNVPYDGIEWLNADSEWRDKPASRLVSTALRSIVRAPEAVASLFTRPSRTLQRWDTATEARPIVALAAVDAHARMDWRPNEPRGRTLLARPRYEAMFRTLVQAVVLRDPLSGHAADDASRVLGALESGATFSAVRAFAWPGVLEFKAEQNGAATTMGGRLADMSPVRFMAAVLAPADAELLLVRDGSIVTRGKGSLHFDGPPSPGAYRVEAYLPGNSVPWIVSNPIYAGPLIETRVVAPPASPQPLVPLAADRGWRVEHDPASTAIIKTEPSSIELTYALGPGTPNGQYAALAIDVNGMDAFDGVRFVGQAAQPMRVSVQVRLLGGQRWRRSVYLDGTARPVTLALQDLEPIDPASLLRPTAARIRSLLVVVDTLNALPGAKGALTLTNVMLSKAPPDGGLGPTFER